MTTVGKLIELLSVYPKHMTITNEQNEPFIHIVNMQNDIILSTNKPIGYCSKSGEYVYPSKVNGYSAFSPAIDEDLYDFEWVKLENK